MIHELRRSLKDLLNMLGDNWIRVEIPCVGVVEIRGLAALLAAPVAGVFLPAMPLMVLLAVVGL